MPPTPRPARDATTEAGARWLAELERAVRAATRKRKTTTTRKP